MEEMDSRYQQQQTTSLEIDALGNNFKKDAPARKTKAYLQRRIAALDDKWACFQSIHAELQQLAETFQDHPYVRSTLPQKTKRKYEEVMEMILATEPVDAVIDKDNQQASSAETATTSSSKDEHKAGHTADPPASSSRINQKSSASTLNELGHLDGRKDAVQEQLNPEQIKRYRRQDARSEAIYHAKDDLLGNHPNREHAYLEASLNDVKEIWVAFSREHEELVAHATAMDDDFIYFRENAYYTLKREYFQLISDVQNKLKTARETGNFNIPTKPPSVKLPAMNITKFLGDYIKWPSFKDVFISLIGSNNLLSSVQKLHYLKCHIGGEAEQLLRNIDVTGANYLTAWEILEKRYENKRVIVEHHLCRLNKQTPIKEATASAIKSLLDVTTETLRALNNLGRPTIHWDDMIIHIISQKLDQDSRKLWEQGLNASVDMPTWEQLQSFLNARFRTLEIIGSKKPIIQTGGPNKSLSLVTGQDQEKGDKKQCPICHKKDHPIYLCSKFKKMDIPMRWKEVKANKLCFKCLRSSHSKEDCKIGDCKKCGQPHNHLLHNAAETEATATVVTPDVENAINLAATSTNGKRVILATALVIITSIHGDEIQCRAILDSGSQLNFISEALQKKLGYTASKKHQGISGIGESRLKADRSVMVQIKSKTNGFSVCLEAFVLKMIAPNQPTTELNIENWKIPKNIQLADPNFHKPGKIDMLIGAEFYCSLMSVGQIKIAENLPMLQNTTLGWVVLGRAIEALEDSENRDALAGIVTQFSDAELSNQLTKFWEIENVESSKAQAMTSAEQVCVDHFEDTHIRDECNRYVLRLPFITEPSMLGDSREMATRRFLNLERRLNKDQTLKMQYANFLKEYQELGHMKEIQPTEISKPNYFLPHHCVIKPDSTTTKLRVVFDASARTTNGTSLNDILACGPTIQEDLFAILTRFRMHQYVLTADIAKMYRQIKIDEADQKMQLIIWREDPKQNLKYFQLNTLTYGTKPATFMATKTLHNLADINLPIYPQAAYTTKRDFYVDDLMTGCDDLGEAKRLQFEMQLMLNSAGFPLRKWCSNEPVLMRDIPPVDRAHEMEITDNNEIKTLGMTWHPITDIFSVRTSWGEKQRITKRTVLSDTAHLFDPLGLVNPTIVLAKIFMQKLWALRVDWDEALPLEMNEWWDNFRNQLHILNKFHVPRRAITSPSGMQLHAFSDASEKAYGAAVYCRSINTEGAVTVRLLCSKSRVAPVKTETLPRLELSAAVLAMELVKRILTATEFGKDSVTYWTDSEIVLAWVNSETASLKTFIRNRVASIQKNTSPGQWRHVPTRDNPADIVSRGMYPEKLLESRLWNNGPAFLKEDQSGWPSKVSQAVKGFGEGHSAFSAAIIKNSIMDVMDHKNSFNFAQNTMAYILRFINNARKSKGEREYSATLTVPELDNALKIMVKEIQMECFPDDIKKLRNGQKVANNSKLVSLDAFLDTNGLIRVGGRIKAANIPYNAKHPILLPSKHAFTDMLLSHLHLKQKHAGPALLAAEVRHNFWPLQIKVAVRKAVQRCVICVRAKPLLMKQIMGQLPAARVQPGFPFLSTGVDFCGPFMVHYKIRGKVPTKAYLAVFVCFASKGVHLELVSDLTTAAFIGCLKRFIARKGTPNKIYCDNATNFVGARNELQELQTSINSTEAQKIIIEYCSKDGIEWKFIPPRSPHFGGLWEAAVKSAKTHLKKILHNQKLTFEELSTVVAEVEAVLNSRPLTDPSTDPNDLEPVTPAHLIYGRALTTINDHGSIQRGQTLSQGWKIIKEIKSQFWDRWSSEYLSSLQPRSKWRNSTDNLEPGTLVIIKDANQPPLKWKMARVIKVHPGGDGRTRQVSIKTASGTTTAVIQNLCPLPVEQQMEWEKTEEPINEFCGFISILGSNKRRKKPLQRIAPIKRLAPEPSARENAIQRPLPGADLAKNNAPDRNTNIFSRGVSKISMVMLMMAIVLIYPAPAQTAATTAPIYKITPLNISSGLLYEEIGRVNLATDEWDLLVYYDTTNYWLESNLLESYITKLKETACNTKTNYCNATMAQLGHQMNDIKAKNELLKYNKELRKKRSPLDIIGNVAHAMFGILDSNSASEYERKIQAIWDNENNLQMLLQNQTSILEATANVIKKDEEEVLQQFVEFKNEISKLRQIQEHQQVFTTIALHTMLTMNSYQRMQDTLIDVVMSLQHGKIAPEIITPEQLQIQLNIARKHIPTHLTIPKTESITQLYQLLSVKGRITEKHILISIKIPLISTEEYQLFHMASIPTLHADHMVSIQPSAEQILVNMQRNLFQLIKNEELQKCIHNGEHLICYQHQPLYTEKTSTNNCEFALLDHAEVAPDSCKISIGPIANTWVSLHKRNNWVFVYPKEETIDIICNNKNIYTERLCGTGIIELGPSCVIKQTTITISSHSRFHGNIKSAYIPSANLSEQLVYHKANISLKVTGRSATLVEQIQNLKQAETRIHLSHHDMHQYAISYTTALILVAVLIGLSIRLYNNKGRAIITTAESISIPLPPLARPRNTPSRKIVEDI